jgi:hypothetical protein
MKTLYRDCQEETSVQPNQKAGTDVPAWVSLMGIAWLYGLLKKSEVFAKDKAAR